MALKLINFLSFSWTHLKYRDMSRIRLCLTFASSLQRLGQFPDYRERQIASRCNAASQNPSSGQFLIVNMSLAHRSCNELSLGNLDFAHSTTATSTPYLDTFFTSAYHALKNVLSSTAWEV